MSKILLNDTILIDPVDVSVGDIQNNGIGFVLLLTVRPTGHFGNTRVVKVDYPTRDEAVSALREIAAATAAEPGRLAMVNGEGLIPSDMLPERRALVWLTAPADRHGSPNALANNESDIELIADCGVDADRWAEELGDIIRDEDSISSKDGLEDAWLSLWFAAAMEAAKREALRGREDAMLVLRAEHQRETSETEARLRVAFHAEAKAAGRAVQFMDDMAKDAVAARADIMSLRSVNLPVGDET